jgi:hypothetical protein
MALGVFIGLQMTTLWGIDMQVQQRLAELRSEARALALSVAPSPIPDADNAALIYAEAFEAIKFREDWEQAWRDKWDESWNNPSSPKCDFQDPDLESFLRHQAGTLALLREAAAMPDCYFDRAYYTRPSLGTCVYGLGEMHEAAKLLALNARWNACHGELDAAMTDIKALCRMAEHVSNEPSWFCVLLSAAIDRWALTALADAFAHGELPPDDLAALRLGEGLSYQALARRALRMDEAFVLDIFCQVGVEREYHWLAAFSPGTVCAASGQVYRLFLLEDDLATSRCFWRKYRWPGEIPYYQATYEYDKFQDWIASNSGRLTHNFVPQIPRLAQNVAIADARRRVARVAVAAARYQGEQRGLPEGLEELTPDFIAAIPVDPFDGKPLKFKRTKRGLTIYSIGPDMTDDGGTPFNEEEKTGDITFELFDREEPTI